MILLMMLLFVKLVALWGSFLFPDSCMLALKGEQGIFWDAHSSIPWRILGYNLVGAFSIIFWLALVFGALNYFKLLRVSPEDKFKVMDLLKHGESAYPAAVRYHTKCKGKL